VYGSIMVDVQEAIRNAQLFSQLSKKDIKQLAGTLNQRSFPAGTVIIEKGKPGVGFFIIASGTATVTVAGNRVRSLKAGDHFGEVALIDDGPRMAEVTAETDLECYALTAWQFRPFVQDHPDVAWALMQSLVQRIVRDAKSDDEI
jgi:CRP-like cAMP-binding protein